ncbi:putative PRKR-interacting protein 1 [Hypsibius exemplaris]|uniref:PRKR-interacting protein 1 n=1 Tax=Hypsibius exemplaris TaxID=2072580 RepID=A0A1W0WDA1_HYPEX|nr:putative PRKR-interacting protein 1 [Hypsibius exemplaris]
MGGSDSSGDDERRPARGGQSERGNKAVDTQKIRLERLMQNPDKPAHIPEGPRDKAPPPPAEFVRFYMGSSAGAGSGEFHIYRNLRRKEQNRMKFIEDQAKKDSLRTEFEIQAEKNRLLEEEKTAKKRAKRLKKKSKKGSKKVKTGTAERNNESGSSESEEEEEDSGTVTETAIPTSSANSQTPHQTASNSTPPVIATTNLKTNLTV